MNDLVAPYSEDDFVMLSALQHYLFCPRQCALIHIENIWSENFLTASGRTLHERVDRKESQTRRDIHQATSLRLFSRRLGLTGVADMVEFHRASSAEDERGVVTAARLPGLSGWWHPFPVEYKRGKPKSHRADEVQLCAQALCLEEMLGVAISDGALFYGETRHRLDVVFDDALRSLTECTAQAVHALIAVGKIPSPEYSKACQSCSIMAECRPREFGGKVSARRWMEREIAEAIVSVTGEGTT